ncbi:MAG: hypothetical protein Q9211_004787, partial [Gyalolechia sp. 1 TL-2023]
DENARPVVIKSAPPHLLSNEREILEIVQNHTCVRRMIDIIEGHPSLVLEYLDDNLLDVCSRKRLEGSDVKFVAGAVLEALAVLHENGFLHTGHPANVPFDDEHYGFRVLVEQVRRFGPFNNNFEEIADAERLAICTGAIVYIQENQKWLPFSMSEDDELARPDRDFIAKMMKLDPRDRPTARELLQDAWFKL